MMRVTSAASELKPDDRFCECCKKPLIAKVAWLELDQRVDAYHDLGGVPEENSQGWFPFGMTCARKLKQIALARHYITKAGHVAKVASPSLTVRRGRKTGLFG